MAIQKPKKTSSAITGTPLRQRIASLSRRMTPAAWFFAHVGFGVVVLIAAGWLFGEIAEDVIEGDPLVLVDVVIANWFHAHLFHPVTQAMLAVSTFNGITGISILSLLLAVYFLWMRDWYWLLGLVLTVPGGMLLNVIIKLAFHRVRPHFTDPLVVLATYSFPSGHTMGATVFYGTLAAYLMTRVHGFGPRLALFGFALLMIMVTGFSRVYLGAHFLSDVLAAFAEGCAWLALCLIAVATLQRRMVRRRTPATDHNARSGAARGGVK